MISFGIEKLHVLFCGKPLLTVKLYPMNDDSLLVIDPAILNAGV